MSRRDILNHIRESMADDMSFDPTAKDVVCRECGDVIDFEMEYVIHRVPEHGEDEMTTAVFCGGSCFTSYFNRLLHD